MPRLLYLVCIMFCLSIRILYAQDNKAVQSLLRQYQQAITDSEKVLRLYPLINYHYALNNDRIADSLRDIQLMLAGETRSQSLMLGVLFPVYDNSVLLNSSNQRFNKELGFANQALEYAKSGNMNDFVALAYSRIAAVFRNNGQSDLAEKNADISFTTAINTKNDSIKVVSAIELGDVFMQKKDLLMAFRKFSNALDIANDLRNNYLLSTLYYHFSILYKKLKNIEQAKEFILKSIALNTKSKNINGLIKDYITMAKFVDIVPAKNYLQRATILADSIKNPELKLQIDQTMFDQHMINDGIENTFSFLLTHPDVEQALHNSGEHKYEWIIGEIFLYNNKFDSAYLHFKKAEPAYDPSYNISGRINFYSEFADCCKGLKLYAEAIKYYTITLQLATTARDGIIKNVCLEALQEIYYLTGDYKKAYEYAKSYILSRDSLNDYEKARDLVKGEIDNENKRILKENELELKALERRHDAQYMLITITVAAAFILLVLLGLFTVSANTIRVLGFFSFIFLFELITLILDTWIHDKTHGEPWKIWLIKIGIISMLFPLHHWLEHKLIHYLIGRRLIHASSFFSFRKLFRRPKKQTAPVEIITEAVEAPGDLKSGE